jgi:hypothetical protein
MSEATSKQWRGFSSNNNPTMDALVPTCKNRIRETTILMPDNAPYEYRMYDFIGEETPDGALYPDSVAPIGSTYMKLTITANVVAGANLYLKKTAATWTEL